MNEWDFCAEVSLRGTILHPHLVARPKASSGCPQASRQYGAGSRGREAAPKAPQIQAVATGAEPTEFSLRQDRSPELARRCSPTTTPKRHSGGNASLGGFPTLTSDPRGTGETWGSEVSVGGWRSRERKSNGRTGERL